MAKKGHEATSQLGSDNLSYSVTSCQQHDPYPWAQGLTVITEKNHSMTRKNLAKFEYPQTTRVCELLTRQGVNKEESPFIHHLTITDAATPHKGLKTPNTATVDATPLSLSATKAQERQDKMSCGPHRATTTHGPK